MTRPASLTFTPSTSGGHQLVRAYKHGRAFAGNKGRGRVTGPKPQVLHGLRGIPLQAPCPSAVLAVLAAAPPVCQAGLHDSAELTSQGTGHVHQATF
ncbi:hypothetical protein WJX79_010240 [Trebouxia sp. C0005]